MFTRETTSLGAARPQTKEKRWATCNEPPQEGNDRLRRRSCGIGRSSAHAPEIDGDVNVKPPYEPHKKLVVGQFVDVRITTSDAHDLRREAQEPLSTRTRWGPLFF